MLQSEPESGLFDGEEPLGLITVLFRTQANSAPREPIPDN